MRVNVAVCGRFHYHNYARYLETAGVLGRLYYSHRLSTTARALGLSSGRARNLWLKEYLIGLHGKLTNGRWVAEAAPLYADLWQRGVLRTWTSCDILHFLLHGACERIIARAKGEGASIVGEPVNQHPEVLSELLTEECARLGLKHPGGLLPIHQRQLRELREADYLVVPSRVVRESFVARGFDANSAAVIPYGVNLSRFLRRGPNLEQSKSDLFRVLCVAQITPRKGHFYLLEAWKRLRLPNSELLLIGALLADMEPILDRYRGCFRHISKVPNELLPGYYAQASVFVLPSIEDGFSCVCAEAMAGGLPVITTINNGAAEIVSEGSDGFVIPIRDSESLAERLELLYRDRELRNSMAGNARAKAERELGWEAYADKLIGFYEGIFEAGKQVAAAGF